MNRQMTEEHIKEIVKAEYEYWKKAPVAAFEIEIGATAACANILAAIMGFPAPWHPKICSGDDDEKPRQLMTEEEVNRLTPLRSRNGEDVDCFGRTIPKP